MIRTMYRSADGTLHENLTPERVREALQDPQGTLWLDVAHSPLTRDQIGFELRSLFPFHPLAIDDALLETHIPRLDDWGDYLYIVFHALDLEINRSLDTQELDVFLGKNYLVTLHEEPIKALDTQWEQCLHGRERRLASGPDHLLYVVADAIVSDYMTVVDGLDEEIDELEKLIFAHPHARTISRIFRLRRTVLKLRRILGYLREVMNKLARDPFAVIDAADRVYFRDVYDHLVRLYDIIEGLRDMVGGALDTYLSVTSNRMNEIMRALTVVTVLFMPISFISGFFGMNFFGEAYNIPNPSGGKEPYAWVDQVAFWLCMAVMFGLPPIMLWWMRRRGWLRSVVDRSWRRDMDTAADEDSHAR
jgi:magnesium transporter